MDRSWMDMPRHTMGFREGFEKFLTFIKEHATEGDYYFCPCKNCCNNKKSNIMDLRAHVFKYGFLSYYKPWIWHGESMDDVGGSNSGLQNNKSYAKKDVGENIHMHDTESKNEKRRRVKDNIMRIKIPMQRRRVEDNKNRIKIRMYDVGLKNKIRRGVKDDELRNMHDNLVDNSQEPLYPGCTKYPLLKSVLELFNLKVSNGWSDKGFSSLLELLGDMFPDGNLLPVSTYEAKKIICPMGVELCEKIHACHNDCFFYRNEYKDLRECPICNTTRYKSTNNNDLDNPSCGSIHIPPDVRPMILVDKHHRCQVNSFRNSLFGFVPVAARGESIAEDSNYTNFPLSESQPARVTLKCPGKSEAMKLVRLPETIHKLLEIGSRKFRCHCTKVLTIDGAEVDEIELIRDGDQLSLVCDDNSKLPEYS